MKKKEVPQDKSALVNYTRELCYAKNSDGKYEAELSTGWSVKTDALNIAWDEVKRRVEEAKAEVNEGRKSPVFYFMELRLMDIGILSGYTGFWKFSVKRHLKPSVFNKLPDNKLLIYAKAFDISIDELKNFKG
ncbi:MAG: hypothetical protein V1904_05980 [Bacteroidota bacterium]